jgi:adenylate kinase
VHHLSTGAILRQEVSSGTALGRRVEELMADGHLVPDATVLKVVKHRLDDADVQRRGFLLDGFPRTEPQASALIELLGDSPLDAVINLEVPAAVVRKRLLVRRVCSRCETPTVARNREHTVYAYEEQAGPLLAVFAKAGILVEVESLGAPDEVFERVMRGLKPVLWGAGEAVG